MHQTVIDILSTSNRPSSLSIRDNEPVFLDITMGVASRKAALQLNLLNNEVHISNTSDEDIFIERRGRIRQLSQHAIRLLENDVVFDRAHRLTIQNICHIETVSCFEKIRKLGKAAALTAAAAAAFSMAACDDKDVKDTDEVKVTQLGGENPPPIVCNAQDFSSADEFADCCDEIQDDSEKAKCCDELVKKYPNASCEVDVELSAGDVAPSTVCADQNASSADEFAACCNEIQDDSEKAKCCDELVKKYPNASCEVDVNIDSGVMPDPYAAVSYCHSSKSSSAEEYAECCNAIEDSELKSMCCEALVQKYPEGSCEVDVEILSGDVQPPSTYCIDQKSSSASEFIACCNEIEDSELKSICCDALVQKYPNASCEVAIIDDPVPHPEEI